MKLLGLFIFLGLLQSCDPYGFGFKENPAYILDQAFQAVLDQDHETFIDVSGKEALCLYGNPTGITYLKNKLNIDAERVELKSTLIANSNKYTNPPHFVGFWSYYTEKYQVDISDKTSKTELLKVVVNCHYGFEGPKNAGYYNLKLKKYKMKQCRLIKVIPLQFAPLPIREECLPLKVDL